jgi:hypothetical protein
MLNGEPPLERHTILMLTVASWPDVSFRQTHLKPAFEGG